jgi:hypothetical protein
VSDDSLLPVPKTSEGLRDALFDEINGLRAGTTSPQKARAISLLASHVIDSLRVQIQHGRLLLDSDRNREVFLGSGNKDQTKNT